MRQTANYIRVVRYGITQERISVFEKQKIIMKNNFFIPAVVEEAVWETVEPAVLLAGAFEKGLH